MKKNKTAKAGIRKGTYFFLMLLMIAAFSSCKTKRGAMKAPVKEEGPEYLFAKMKEHEFRYHTFSAKFTVEYKANRKYFDFKGQVRIVKDSIIWLTLGQDLGMELARLMLTRDSVKYLDRIHKTYFLGDYKFVSDFLKTNIDFGILQSILLGNDFEYYEDAEFKASVDGGEYRLTTSGRSKLKKYVRSNADAQRVFLQSIWLNPETFKITRIKIKELTAYSKKLCASYSQFQEINGSLFPAKTDYEIDAETPIKLKVKYSKVTVDQPLKFNFKIPSKYQPAN